MDVITESPIFKTVGVPPLSEPDWMRPSEILFQFQSQFLTHTQLLVGYQELLGMFFPMLSIEVFHYGLDSFAVFFLLFFLSSESFDS